MNKKEISDSRLYGILDLGYVDRLKVTSVARAMIAGGIDLIQLRGKNFNLNQLTTVANELHRITSDAGVPLIINDHPEVAREVKVEGVHVGQDDKSIAEVRAIVARPIMVGKSTHGLEQAISAEKEGADYIGFGPVYATPTKPDYPPIGLDLIRKVHQTVGVPIFCIGGIKLHNLRLIIEAGGRRAVIVSELLQSPDVEEYTRTAKKMLARGPALQQPQSEI